MDQLTLEGTADYKPSYRAQIVQSLADFRREWQKLMEAKIWLMFKLPVD